jgi:NMD protein affecting ribosome stability and mRNA decay
LKRLCCACGTERDLNQDKRLELMSDDGFRLLEPGPLAEPTSNERLRLCRGCGATYLMVRR